MKLKSGKFNENVNMALKFRENYKIYKKEIFKLIS